MAKKKTSKKKDEAEVPGPDGLDANSETKIQAYDEIVTQSAVVDRLEAKYARAKDSSLAAKKTFDAADKGLRELIRAYEHGDTDPGLFQEEEQEPTTGKKKTPEEKDQDWK